MADRYYSERLAGDAPREDQTISAAFWRGFVAFVKSRARDGWFAERYPVHCFETPLPVETALDALGAAFAAHNPRVPWPLDAHTPPALLDVLDSVEFFARIVSHRIFAHSRTFCFDAERFVDSVRHAVIFPAVQRAVCWWERSDDCRRHGYTYRKQKSLARMIVTSSRFGTVSGFADYAYMHQNTLKGINQSLPAPFADQRLLLILAR